MNQIETKLLHIQKRLGQSPEAALFIEELKTNATNLVRQFRLQGYNQDESIKKTLLALDNEQPLMSEFHSKYRKPISNWKIGLGIIGTLLITLQLFFIGIGGIWLNISIGAFSTSSNTWFVPLFFLTCVMALNPISALFQEKYIGWSIMYGGLVLYMYVLMYISPLELFICNILYLLVILKRTKQLLAVFCSMFIQILFVLMFIGVNQVNMSVRTKMGLYEIVDYRHFFVLHIAVLILPVVCGIACDWILKITKRA